MAELAVLTVVGSEPEAALLCSLLESEGIPCIQQPTNFAAGAGDGLSTVGPREIPVHADRLAEAREVLDRRRPV
jgi:hypothetical protein